MGPFGAITEPFWVLYDEVTEAIREEIADRGFNPSQCEYLEYLVAAFFKEYGQWTSAKWTDGYLALFRHRAPYRVLHLIGQAYLHIAYDLPRVVADFGRHQALTPELDAAYLALQPALERALQRCANKRRAFGRFAFLSYLPGTNQLYATLLYWVIALRSVALTQGRILGSANDRARRMHERKIRRIVRLSARHALEHAYIPTGWLAALKPPVLMLAVFPISISFTVDWWHVLLAIVAVVVFYAIRTLALSRHVTQFVQVFGQDLVERLGRLTLDKGSLSR